MILAAVDDTGYNILLLLHILSAFVAFAPSLVHPILHNQLKDSDGAPKHVVLDRIAKNGRMIYAPALILTGLLGFGVAGLSDEVYKVSQGWLVASVLIWIVMNGLLHAVLLPAERAVAEGDEAARGRMDATGGAIVILLVVMLVLMIWKPGL